MLFMSECENVSLYKYIYVKTKEYDMGSSNAKNVKKANCDIPPLLLFRLASEPSGWP